MRLHMKPGERTLRYIERQLAARPDNEVACVALIGQGHEATRSIYELYLRFGSGSWYSVEGQAGRSRIDPIAKQKGNDARGAGVMSIVGTVADLANVTCHPERPALVRVLKCIESRAA